MMAVKLTERGLIERLPLVRGAFEANADIARFTWFRTGGAAEILFRPADIDDLAEFMAGCPADVPLTVIGIGSNVLVRDGGVDGVVIRLGKPFAAIEARGVTVSAGAAATDVAVAARARDASIGGLEFLTGIPGTVGGAVAMNAGAYGREISDVLIGASTVSRGGARRDIVAADMAFGYRRSRIGADDIVVSAMFRGHAENKQAIARRMEEIREAREDSQPLRTRTGGSTFRNPDGDKAWRLIDRAGCRGLSRGAAQVSEKHCNFLINTGGATAADIEGLGEDVRRRVLDASGVTLDWEIRRIGSPALGIEEAPS